MRTEIEAYRYGEERLVALRSLRLVLECKDDRTELRKVAANHTGAASAPQRLVRAIPVSLDSCPSALGLFRFYSIAPHRVQDSSKRRPTNNAPGSGGAGKFFARNVPDGGAFD